MFVDALQVDIYTKYDLRPRHKEANEDNQPQLKNSIPSLSMDKVKELKNIIKTKEVGEYSKMEEKEVKELEESIPPFNIEKELSKIKIHVPLEELSKDPSYYKHIEKVIQRKGLVSLPDTVNLQDESPTIVFVPHIDDEESVSPFYVTLNIHDKMLHDCMLDFGDSHNLVPKVVMEKLGLEITRPFHDLYSFDARKGKCDGLMKDMVVTLAHLSVNSIMMDVVVDDVLANYGMFLSRTWERNLGGTINMDINYAIIPVFRGENRRLYRETKFSYVVSDQNKSINHPIYFFDEYLGYFILTINE
jgi:hypothetical protein